MSFSICLSQKMLRRCKWKWNLGDPPSRKITESCYHCSHFLVANYICKVMQKWYKDIVQINKGSNIIVHPFIQKLHFYTFYQFTTCLYWILSLFHEISLSFLFHTCYGTNQTLKINFAQIQKLQQKWKSLNQAGKHKCYKFVPTYITSLLLCFGEYIWHCLTANKLKKYYFHLKLVCGI